MSVEDVTESLYVAFMIRSYAFARRNGVGGLDQWLGQCRGSDILSPRPGKQSQARDLAWEFVVASQCSRFATETRFAEPDVRCAFDGEQWGIACKVFYSSDGDRQIDCLVEGAAQLARYSDLDRGGVLVNVTPLLRHESWGHGRVSTTAEAYERLSEDMTRVANKVHRSKLYARFLERDNASCFMFFGQTLFDVEGYLGLNAAAMFPMNLRPPSDHERRFLQAFNYASSTIWQ